MCLISTIYVQGIVMCISIGVFNIVLCVYAGVVLCIGIVVCKIVDCVIICVREAIV